jgi:hypothetical protein
MIRFKRSKGSFVMICMASSRAETRWCPSMPEEAKRALAIGLPEWA